MKNVHLGKLVAIAALAARGTALAATPIAWQPQNIAWPAVAESTNSTPRLSTSSAGGAARVLTRTLTLDDGHVLRVRERLVANAAGGEDRVYEGGEKLDELRIVASGDTIEAVLAVLRERGCPVIRRYGRLGTIVRARLAATLDDAGRAEIMRAVETCGARGGVRAGLSPMNFYNAMAEPTAKPNDPLLKYQWHLDQVGAREAWENDRFGYPDIACAVFDTGVKLTHEDLQVNVRRRVSALKSDPSPEDHHGHGSHCLGIMGADGNNGKGISGVGQVADLTSIRGPISYGTAEDDILDGYQWALEHDIKVLSCSFGTSPGVPGDEATSAIIGELQQNGCLVVIAAGNDGNDNDRVPTYPASYTNENIITVIATGKDDQPTNADQHGWNTSYGATSCDIAAPGSEILSCTRDSDSSYEAWEGTSMATPLVAACAAMVWEQNPHWTWREVRDRLYATATPSTNLIGYCATGARVNLKAALDQKYAISIAPLAKKAYEVGEELQIKVNVSCKGIPEEQAAFGFDANLILINRDHPEWMYNIDTPHLVPGENVITYHPINDDIGRGWLFKVEGKELADEAVGYSSVFRVREAGKVETFKVDKPTEGARLDAASIAIAFTPSDALYADLAIEHLGADGVWTPETTLGLAECKPGQTKTTTVELKGLGWISEQPYRIVVSDNDDPSVFGRSAEFYIDRSTMSVTMEIEGLDSNPEADNVWPVGEERRLTCRLPQTDLYWLLLVDNASGEVMVLKETWTDITDPVYQKERQFGLTIPEEVGLTDEGGNPREFYLELVDAFDMTMYRDSPVFTLAPRKDGLHEPTIDEALGVPTNYYFQGNGQWYPSRTDDGWELRCGYVGAGENAFFETDVTGPITVEYEVRKNDFPGTLKFEYAKAPIMKATTWYEVEDGRIPAGDWHLRWTYQRTDKSELPPKRELNLAIANMSMLLTMPDVKIRVKSDNSGDYLRIEGGNWPTNVHYTLDGSTPDRDSPQWVDGMNQSPYKFRLDRSMRIRAYADMEDARPGLVDQLDYFFKKGSGTESDPIRIEDPYDLAAFAETVLAGNAYSNQFVKLMNDLDMTGVPMRAIGWEGYIEGGEDAVVLLRQFSGTFDGGNHVIANLAVVNTTVNGNEPVRALFGCAYHRCLVRNLTLANADAPLVFRDMDGYTAIVTENCTESKAVPSGFNPPPFSPPDYGDYGRPTAVTPLLFCDAMPLHSGDTIWLPYPGSAVTDHTQRQDPGPWVTRYTTDGSEPTAASPVLPVTLPLYRDFTLRAKIFAEPWYEPGPTLTVTFKCEGKFNGPMMFLIR